MLHSMILNKLLSSQEGIFQVSFIILVLIKVTLHDTKGWSKNTQKTVCPHTKT